ncbi:MAG: nuclear transport factor 2 family protein [Ginsengibacter sp.]
MKKTIKLSLLLVIICATAFINPLAAQMTNEDHAVLAKKYEDAYNKKDDKAMLAMYTKDATRITPDGTEVTGTEAIGKQITDEFAHITATLTITPQATAEKDGIITGTGTFRVVGTNDKGEKIDQNGTYINTMTKEGGQWKITKSVIGQTN